MKDYFIQYLDFRENNGEEITPESPAIVGPINRRRIDEDIILNACKRVGKRIGIHIENGRTDEKFTTHNLRHYFTTLMIENGMRIEYVDDLRGDQRVASRDEYYHIPMKKLKNEFMKCSPHYNIPKDLLFFEK